MPIEAVRAVTGGKAPRQHGAMEHSAAPAGLDTVRRYRHDNADIANRVF